MCLNYEHFFDVQIKSFDKWHYFFLFFFIVFKMKLKYFSIIPSTKMHDRGVLPVHSIKLYLEFKSNY